MNEFCESQQALTGAAASSNDDDEDDDEDTVSSMSISSTVATLEDSGQLQGHGPTVAAVQLLPAICIKVIKRTKHCKRLRTYSGHIISRLSSLLRSSYSSDHDIGSVSDLFLQSDKDVIAKNIAVISSISLRIIQQWPDLLQKLRMVLKTWTKMSA
eukprot:595181_1